MRTKYFFLPKSMKNIILLLAITVFFSCRKEYNEPLSNNTQNTTINKTAVTIPYGDALISNYEFVNQLKITQI